jgi:hypothetical protein
MWKHEQEIVPMIGDKIVGIVRIRMKFLLGVERKSLPRVNLRGEIAVLWRRVIVDGERILLVAWRESRRAWEKIVVL